MQKLLLLSIGAALALPQAGLATEVTGAEIGLSYSTLADSKARDVNKTTLGGAVELGFGPQFSVQGDIATRYLDGIDESGKNATAHAIYHLPGDMAVGAFIGKDWLAGQSVEYTGLEAAGTMGAIDYEAAFTHMDSEGTHGNQLGLQANYALNPQLGLGGRFDTLHSEGDNMSRLSATAGYRINPGTMLTGELGFVDGDGMDAESFVGIGLKATFGATGGVTFGGRGLQEFIPGL